MSAYDPKRTSERRGITQSRNRVDDIGEDSASALAAQSPLRELGVDPKSKTTSSCYTKAGYLDLALAILHEEIEHEAWFSEFLGHGPSGHYSREWRPNSPYVSKFLNAGQG